MPVRHLEYGHYDRCSSGIDGLDQIKSYRASERAGLLFVRGYRCIMCMWVCGYCMRGAAQGVGDSAPCAAVKERKNGGYDVVCGYVTVSGGGGSSLCVVTVVSY